MDKFYIFIGLIVYLIVLFRRELLIQKESFRLILGASIGLFFIGVVLHFTDAGRYSASGALLCPLISLFLFRLYRKWFIKWFKHEPQDTFFKWEAGQGSDRLFNFVYFVPTALLMMLIITGMRALANAGW